MITPEKAQQDYEVAVSALQESALTPGMSSAERMTIRDTIREFTVRYLGQLELEIHALTNQYESFLASMAAVVDTLKGGATPVTLLNRLTNFVKTGTALVNAATAPPPTGAKALSRHAARALAVPDASAGGDKILRLLCVHGVGHQEADPAFEATWREAISRGLSEWSYARPFEIQFVAYDDLFAADPPNAAEVAIAVVKMGVSGLLHGIGDLFRQRRGFGGVAESVRWTAGMVVQWAENDGLRAAARQRVLDHARKFKPHVILAHSLGSLLSYDAFARGEGRELIAGRTFVSFGSQIGNPFVRSTLGGRIVPLPKAKHWYHLFNPHDDAFAAPLRLPSANFEQVDAEFDVDGILDHDAGEYLRHPNTSNIVWRTLGLQSAAGRGMAHDASNSARMLTKQAANLRATKTEKPKRRALLVGINDYPNPADRLEGCVNDVFLMSSLLQESGFAADDIRIVLNDRATARGIVERLEWLLDGTADGQDRVFYYSGHGAQIPGYGVGEKVDRKDECLVAYDFDWSREHAVTDDQFYELYSQLPYKTHFLTIFDCCHSGGMTRDGAARVRGLTPPDDIRHRELKWNAEHQMWVARDFGEASEAAKALLEERAGAGLKGRKRQSRQARFGPQGDVQKLGVCAPLRARKEEFEAACKDFDHKGPFMPIILQACQEKQYSYEYRHGVQSYGAFTYSLGLILRAAKQRKQKLNWTQLKVAITSKLADLKYDQEPGLVCPRALKTQPIPWSGK